jgi:hypothetical protein
MAPDETTKALCHKCHGEMIYVTSLPHPRSPQMQRTTFVCYACNQTRSYTLSAAMAAAYAQACARAREPEDIASHSEPTSGRTAANHLPPGERHAGQSFSSGVTKPDHQA